VRFLLTTALVSPVLGVSCVYLFFPLLFSSFSLFRASPSLPLFFSSSLATPTTKVSFSSSYVANPTTMASSLLSQPTPQVDRRTNSCQSPTPRIRGFSQGMFSSIPPIPYQFIIQLIPLSLSAVRVCAGARVFSPNHSHLQEGEGKGLYRVLSLCFMASFSS